MACYETTPRSGPAGRPRLGRYLSATAAIAALAITAAGCSSGSSSTPGATGVGQDHVRAAPLCDDVDRLHRGVQVPGQPIQGTDDLPVMYQPNGVYSLTEIANNLKGVLPQSPTLYITPENWYFVK